MPCGDGSPLKGNRCFLYSSADDPADCLFKGKTPLKASNERNAVQPRIETRYLAKNNGLGDELKTWLI